MDRSGAVLGEQVVGLLVALLALVGFLHHWRPWRRWTASNRVVTIVRARQTAPLRDSGSIVNVIRSVGSLASLLIAAYFIDPMSVSAWYPVWLSLSLLFLTCGCMLCGGSLIVSSMLQALNTIHNHTMPAIYQKLIHIIAGTFVFVAVASSIGVAISGKRWPQGVFVMTACVLGIILITIWICILHRLWSSVRSMGVQRGQALSASAVKVKRCYQYTSLLLFVGVFCVIAVVISGNIYFSADDIERPDPHQYTFRYNTIALVIDIVLIGALCYLVHSTRVTSAGPSLARYRVRPSRLGGAAWANEASVPASHLNASSDVAASGFSSAASGLSGPSQGAFSSVFIKSRYDLLAKPPHTKLKHSMVSHSDPPSGPNSPSRPSQAKPAIESSEAD